VKKHGETSVSEVRNYTRSVAENQEGRYSEREIEAVKYWYSGEIRDTLVGLSIETSPENHADLCDFNYLSEYLQINFLYLYEEL